MKWNPFSTISASSVQNGEVKKPRPRRMTLTSPKQVGQYTYPPEIHGIKVWGWEVVLDGSQVATMTADDRDLDEQRKTAERMCFAYNLEFGSDKPRNDNR